MNWYIRGLALAVVLFNVTGNYFLSIGMRSIGPMDPPTFAGYVKAVLHPNVLIGIALLICWLIAQLSLFSWADLTYVMPITASAYVLTALLGAFSLHERVPPSHWLGILLIAGGVMVVSRTRARTAPVPDKEMPQ
jgi:drug/metabolite transporter (DMT)-like permease